MPPIPRPNTRLPAMALVAATALALAPSCGRRVDETKLRAAFAKAQAEAAARRARALAPYQAEVAEQLGAAIEIVVDTSGSMRNATKDDPKAKHVVARKAIEKMLAVTDAFRKKKPKFPIRVGLLHFASAAYKVLPIQDYDAKRFRAALQRLPKPGGGTAIGRAMHVARRELYRGGAYRKHMIVITDGKNGSGPDPARVAKEIFRRSEGAVQFHFVAFDTDAAKFGFLKDVGGEVLSARNGIELGIALKDIYEGKILAEADYGETELYDPRKDSSPR